jgi:uncharacterized protein (TIGR03437 family)
MGEGFYMKMPGSLALKLCLCVVAMASTAISATTLSLTASPGAVDFQYSPPQPTPLPINVVVVASDGSTPVLGATITPGPGTPAGLFPPPPVNGTVIQVGFNLSAVNVSLTAIYTATMTVTAAGFPSLNVPIAFSVGGSLSIIPSPAALAFDATGALSQTVALAGNGGAAISFTTTASTSGGGNWLSVTANVTFTPATLTVTINPLNVPVGTYQGSVTVIPLSGLPVSIPVTLQVGTNTVGASPSSLAFAYTAAGTIPAPQVVQLSSPLPTDTYTAQAASSGNWLLVNGVTTLISGSLPGTLNVTVNPAGLAAATYSGTINIVDAQAGTETVTVTLVVSALSIVANPTSLTFVTQVGGAVPPPQTIEVNGSGISSFTATASPTFISISSAGGKAPGQVIVTASPAGLAAGTYTGKVEIIVNTHVQDVQVTLIVSPTAVLTANPGELIFNYTGGSPNPASTALDVNVSSGAQQAFSIATGVPSWLQVSSANPTIDTPDNLSISVTPKTLATGMYEATVILTPTAAGGVPVIVPVLLNVSGAPAVVPNPTTLSFTGVTGSPQSKTVQVTASTTTNFTATASTVSGGNWLSVSPSTGVASLGNTALTVTADATSLGQGIYQGTVTLTTTGGVVTAIPVTFTVASGSGPIGISPSTLAFTYIQNGTLPAPQTLLTSGAQSFSVSASTSTGGAWLAVTPASGAGDITLTVAVNPVGLALGTYSGTVTVTPTGGAAQTVPVTLTVAGPTTLVATPTPLAFSYIAGNPAPGAQALSITTVGAAVTLTATPSSSGWLAVTPTSAATPASLSVSVSPTNLAAGVYNGSIAVSADSGSLQLNVPVKLTVTAPLPIIDHVSNSASYLTGGVAPGEIVTIFGASLGPVQGVGAGIDSKGFIETTLANVTVLFNGFAAPILYASTGQINAIVPYELTGTSNASVEVMFGGARSNSPTLAVVSSAPGIYSANASGQGGGAILDLHYQLVSASNPASAGSIIQIFATGQGQTSPGGVDGMIEPVTLPLPIPLASAGVTIGGVPATIQYIGAAPGLVAGALQINVVVPPGVPSGAAALFLSFGGIGNSQAGLTVAIQ